MNISAAFSHFVFLKKEMMASTNRLKNVYVHIEKVSNIEHKFPIWIPIILQMDRDSVMTAKRFILLPVSEKIMYLDHESAIRT